MTATVDLTTAGQSVNEDAGTVLAREGGTGNEFVVVLEGEVEVRRGDEVVATLGPGDYVGEIALLDDRPRTATAVAKTSVVVEVISRPEFATLLADVPDVAAQIMATMAERLSEDGLA